MRRIVRAGPGGWSCRPQRTPALRSRRQVSSYFAYPLAPRSRTRPRFLPSRPPRDWERIARNGERLRFSEGDVIVREGELDTSFAIVLTVGDWAGTGRLRTRLRMSLRRPKAGYGGSR